MATSKQIGDRDCVGKYRVTVKHDRGLITLIVWAQNTGGAIRTVMAAEGCPRGAIVRIRPA